MSWRGKASSAQLAELKTILEHIWSPEALDDHPWTKMGIVRRVLAAESKSPDGGAGAALLTTINSVFEQMMPSVPPRRGVRLDTRWGEFGLLAARYFAPSKFGTPVPASLRDAWGRIDASILLYVFGHTDGSIPDQDKNRYRLVGNEPEVAPMSTLSDWHQNGLQHLCERVHLSEEAVQRRAPEDAETPESTETRKPGAPARRRFWAPLLAGAVLTVLAVAGVKAYQIYSRAMQVKDEVQLLESSLRGDSISQAFLQSGVSLRDLNAHLGQLEAELRPILWLTPGLRWLPVYGDDLAQAGDLLDLAVHLSASATNAQAALAPLVPTYDGSARPPVAELIALLSKASPQLQLSLEELQLAQLARAGIDPELLVPQLGNLITEQLDPAMALMQDALPVAITAPSLMGAGDVGPRTYLLLAQNEDELRPTGGFITAVGKVVLDRGRVVDLTFEDSGDLDNWSMPYPLAPWQLSQFMNSPVLVLRDSNWFPDFPTSTLYVRQLYAYVHQDSVNGVVAFDQHFLVMLLKSLGSVQVDAVDYPITADNVVEFMRSSKSRPVGKPVPAGWTRKSFVGDLASAILDRVLEADSSELRAIADAALDGLEERHLIVEVDDPDVHSVFARRGWNGRLQSDFGDFLTVADSNVGFNKTNAVIETQIAYEVDLSAISTPVSRLAISHTNRASAAVPCLQWNGGQITSEPEYPIDRCYWDYMRVYAASGTQLIGATPQQIPEAWMLLNRSVPPTVDVLDEQWPGLQGFGTLIVVPGGGKIDTEMRFALPAGRVLTRNADGTYTYRLEVRKQPGTIAVPLTVKIRLPAGATLTSPSSAWVVTDADIVIETDLRVDLHLEVTFRQP